jgi:DNA helicase HerA-like ATPase
MRTTRDGRGYISILAAQTLMNSPRLYATFLLFLLSELFAKLPEVGDPDRPKLVFFFDEAHLLFKDAPKALLQKVEQVVRLIRSKGVGVYFVTQNPLDVPDTVSSQLGNRVQHALRAFTPMEQKAVKAAATTFRANPAFNTEKAIMELGVGEALVSTLDDRGQPTIVQRTLIHPPNSRVGPVTDAERKAIIAESPVAGVYDKRIERESASEILEKRAEDEVATQDSKPDVQKSGTAKEDSGGGMFDWILGTGSRRRLTTGQKVAREMTRRTGDEIGAAIGKSIGGKTGESLGRSVFRSIIGGFLKR